MARSSPSRSVALSVLLLATAFAVAPPRASAQDTGDMRHRMNDLVDSVNTAVHDAEAASKKREVLDLGQSLHLLESKFSGLRAALQAEMGAKSSKFVSHANVAKDLMDRSGELVKSIVSQREELRKLSGDITEVDSAIRALREGLTNFERDAAELSKLMGQLHVSHSELRSAHEEARSSVREMMADTNDAAKKSTHGLFYLLLLIEIAIFVAFLYFKRPGKSMAHKAYGKFG